MKYIRLIHRTLAQSQPNYKVYGKVIHEIYQNYMIIKTTKKVDTWNYIMINFNSLEEYEIEEISEEEYLAAKILES